MVPNLERLDPRKSDAMTRVKVRALASNQGRLGGRLTSHEVDDQPSLTLGEEERQKRGNGNPTHQARVSSFEGGRGTCIASL